MPDKTWRQISAQVIHEQFTEIRKAQPDTVSDAEILRRISRDHYPFYERENYPYKAWLLAMKDYRIALRLEPTAKELQADLPLFQ